MATYKVEGMSCQGCVKGVTAAFSEAVPGEQVSVDLEQGTLTIADSVAEATVKETVEDAGFDFKGAA